VKIRKPDDEKYFKDIVLNDILEEISNEDNIQIGTTTQKEKREPSKKKLFNRTILFTILTASLLLFMFMLSTLVTDATSEEKSTPQIPTVITPQTDEQAWKMEKDRLGYKKSTSTKIVKKETKPKKSIATKVIKVKPKKSKVIPIQKTEHELAKEALRQQMLN